MRQVKLFEYPELYNTVMQLDRIQRRIRDARRQQVQEARR